MTRSSENGLGAKPPVAFWTNAPGAECSSISAGWYALTGQRDGRALGAGWLEAVHRDDRDRVEHGFAHAYEKQVAVSVDYRLRCADGRFRGVTDAGAPHLDRDGRFLGIVGSVAERPPPPDPAELSIASDPLVQGLFKQTTAGIAIVRRNGRFVRVNDRFCDITGRGRRTLSAMHLHDLAHAEDRPRAAQLFERLMDDGSSAECDTRYVRPDGSAVWVQNTIYTITSSDGQSRFGVVIALDISDRQRIEFEQHLSQYPDRKLASTAFDDPSSLLNTLLRNRKHRND